jgi:hypothetical protein
VECRIKLAADNKMNNINGEIISFLAYHNPGGKAGERVNYASLP